LPEPAAPAAAEGEAAAAPAAAGAEDAAAAMDTDAPAAPAAAAANGGPPPAPELSPEMKDKLTKLRDILSGKTPIALNLEFLYMHNKADLQVRGQTACDCFCRKRVGGIVFAFAVACRANPSSRLVNSTRSPPHVCPQQHMLVQSCGRGLLVLLTTSCWWYS
jgi:hypothetical protein